MSVAARHLLGLSSSLVALAIGCGGDDQSKVVADGDTSLDTLLPDVDFETDARVEISLPPDFGDPCDGNEDCTSGYCVEGPSGFVCTKGCVEECPDGWGCRGVQSGSADLIFVCLQDGSSTPDTVIVDTGDASDTQIPADTSIDVETIDASDTLDTVADTDTGPTGNLCEAAPGTGSDPTLRTESSELGGDWPDCLVGCDFEANPTLWVVDLRGGMVPGVRGMFDFEEHLYDFDDGQGGGPDIDIVPVKAAARTMLELAVLKDAQASFTNPLVYVSDGFAVRTFNADVNDGNSCARTTIAFPYVSDLPLYVVTEESTNYDLWGPTGYADGTVGGGDYGWILRIRATAFLPTELGTLDPGASRALTNEGINLGGELRYYRFYAPGTSSPTVTVTRKSGTGFLPSVVGMKTIEGELVWQRVVEDSGSGVVTLQRNAFRPCAPPSDCPGNGLPCPPNLCTAGDAEYVFAVYDYNGAAGPGSFRFDVNVRVD